MTFVHKPIAISALMLFFLFMLWALGLFVYICHLKKIPVPGSEIHTDAIVVLTGGAERINTGLNLLQAGNAEKILISGVNEKVTLEQIMSLWGGHLDDPERRVYIGHVAQNTRENADETRQWAEQMYVRSIRLVTSNYHMPRALLEFRRAMPDIKIVPHPVFPGGIEKFGGAAPFLLTMSGEYNKAILSWAKLHLQKQE